MTTRFTKTTEGELVGHKMVAALHYVAHREGVVASANRIAKSVGPNGSQDYGYRIVNRCLRKDLLAIDADHEDANPHGRGAVVLTEKGEAFLSEQ